MCCTVYNRDCYHVNDGLEYVVKFTDKDGALIDLTGATFIYALQQGTEGFSSTLSDFLSVIGTGLLQISIPKVNMSVFEVGKIDHQLQVTFSGSVPVTKFTGKITAKTSLI